MRKVLKNDAVQSLIASLICIVLGLLIGYVVLLLINPNGASQAILAVIRNFLNTSRANLRVKGFANTLAKTAPLLMCALSILFSYKVGLFNIGAAGQYVAGACACLYASLGWGWSWLPCMLFAVAVGAVYGSIVGFLKAYANVNEVISGIMLNWIGLYTTNMILASVKEPTSPYTMHLKAEAPQAILPSLGLGKLFGNNPYVTVAVPLSILLAVVLLVVLNKTRFGYELRATGNNKHAAKYAGMAEKRNIILTLMISGGLAALGASLLYQTDYMQWEVTASSVPAMGFNGIAAAFLGGLNPIGTIFASYFIQHITDAGAYVDKTMYSSQISDLISSLIIYLCAFVLFIKHAMRSGIARSEERERRKAAETPEKGGEA
ncbi:MAG: ABC transporter permease [Oscillospiraceae bacterium]|nr:ABC transporter permease [Oscillospiraceae bacterium]MBR3849269.1 ABC transporter permease [Oscillospiraceae bacterium]